MSCEVTRSLCDFPGCHGDTQFTFRFRQSVGRRGSSAIDAYNRDAPASLQVRPLTCSPVREQEVLMLRSISPVGSCTFLWIRLLPPGEGHLCEERLLPEGDSPVCSPVMSLRSGHVTILAVFQSLVLVSRLPYSILFHSILQILAPEFFEKLQPCLETGELVLLASSPPANQL